MHYLRHVRESGGFAGGNLCLDPKRYISKCRHFNMSKMRYLGTIHGIIYIYFFLAQTPESGIPPSYRATRRCTKVHLGFCLRFSTLIGQIGRVPLFGAGPRRYIRSRLFRLAVTAFWRALPFPGGEKASESRDLSSGH